MVAGWYRRTEHHAAAPPGVRELVQPAGDGFGPHDHPTTAMCLACLDDLPAADAVDVGCGSGLLTQAWLRLRRGRVLAVDIDPAAMAHTERALTMSHLLTDATLRCGSIEQIVNADLADRIVFANVPPQAHERLSQRLASPPRALVISGVRAGESATVLAGYRQIGLRRLRTQRRGGFDCHLLQGPS